MIEIVKTATEFALAGVMLAILLLSCAAVLSIVGVSIKAFSKCLARLRRHIRYKRAKREFEEKYKKEKVDIHVL